MKNAFARFIKNEDGATAIECGLIAALLSVAIIASLQAVGNELKSSYNSINTALSGARDTN